MVVIVALSLVSGLLIGCIGIGGVLLVPCLSLAGIEVREAIAASMFSFIFSGAMGVWLYARHGSIDWRSAAFLAAGAAPGAFAGALIAAHASQQVLLALVGATVAFAGWRTLRPQPRRPERGATALQPVSLIGIAAAVGLGSAVTGTGGPVFLVPLLMWRGTPILTSVGLSQAIQIPIALMATAGNFWTGNLDARLGALLSIGIALGTAAGACVAHAVPAGFLARVVAVALVVIGGLVLVRSGHTLVAAW
jgi:uncharacterized protein